MNFEDLKLNAEQVQAVKKIEGPVMVIAGPGTGKTQILASRIAEILKSTDSKAQNILCLTFTDAGTVAMRQRLVSLIGDEAHRISVHTFHSFCNRVIQENPEQFNYRSLQPLSDLDRLEILHQIANELEDDHPLKMMKGNVQYLIPKLSKLFDWMKRENYSASEMIDLCEERRVEIYASDQFVYKVNTKNGAKGDLNMRLVDNEERQLNDLIGGVGLFERYNQKMTASGFYDYNDMILWVIDLFERSPDSLASYHELFHYILVDEFQDTSGSQNKLIEHLTSFWDNPNLFVVGDDDQSIYRFQGAEIKNVADFAHRFKNHLFTVLLTENYRSTQQILDGAKILIDQNQERLVNLLGNLDKNLHSNSVPDAKSNVHVTWFNGQLQEAVWVSIATEKLVESGTNPEEIAIIYRNHSHADLLAEVMSDRGQEIYFRRPENALNHNDVKKILTVLNYAATESSFPFSGDELVFELMHISPVKIEAITCARAAHQIYKEKISWREFFAQLNENRIPDLPLSTEEKKSLIAFGSWLEKLLKDQHVFPLYRFVDGVVRALQGDEASILDTFSLECIRTFLDFVQSECEARPSLSLSELLTKLKLMEDQRLGLSKERLLYDRKGIQFMTAHGSKGLEFEHVFIINCAENGWEKEKANRPYGFINLFSSDAEKANTEEKRRLFYVAMTRAKHSLHMTYHRFDKNRKELVRSSFIDVLEGGEKVTLTEGITPPEEEKRVLNSITMRTTLRSADLLDAHLINKYLQNYQLSISHLNSYLQCPTTFYFENILRVPSAKNKYMAFGTAIHRSLEGIIKLRKTDPEKFTAERLREYYVQNIGRERYVFTSKEFEDFQSLGVNVLGDYFNARKQAWLSYSDMRSEVTLDRIAINGVPVKGQLDLMIVDGKTVQVVDFKTGDATKSGPRLKAPKEGASEEDSIEDRFGGTYWRQMMFYALLIKHNTIDALSMISGTFDFVEPDKKQEFQQKKIMIDPSGLKLMEELIDSCFQKIQNHEFIKGCQEETCRWCSFVAKNGNKTKS